MNSSNEELLKLVQAAHEEQKPHDPFVLRKALVLMAVVPAVVSGFFLESVFVGIAAYFVFVTLADLVIHYVFGLKSSRNVDPGKLILFQHVTPEQFDAYFDTRRWIRCISLGVALTIGALALAFLPAMCLKIFCATYVLSTWIGIWYVRFLGIPRPKLFQRDDRYYVSGGRPRPGHLDPGQLALAFEDKHPFGPIDI